MPKVWNKRDANVPKDAIYIGRGTMFGNPNWMRDQSDKERNRVCNQFEKDWLERDAKFLSLTKSILRGKDLVCWCAPKRCHGDFLLKWANE